MLCKYLPWQLDSGDPCRNDGSGTCRHINSSYDPLIFLIMSPTVNHIEPKTTTGQHLPDIDLPCEH